MGWEPAELSKGVEPLAYHSLPPPPHCREAERASNFAPIRGRSSPGSPCWATGPPPAELEELRRAPRQPRRGERSLPSRASPLCAPPPPGPRPAGSAGDRTSPGRALCICKAEPGSPRLPTPGRRSAAAGAAVGARTPRCHVPAARPAIASPSRYISAGQGTPGGAEDEGARAWAPANCQRLPSRRGARSPRPPRTRLGRSSSWSCDRGGGGARRSSA
ncbi:unnamed protein product [Rangifer tarandus platyrhynchus]|uniref:Uncharacterized protein n=2 Tax=Rangifer tarandus platyrhynchus TaxID=3082113 RepID=A0ACB0ESV7_RANTA|nr:unnamed protein product [Rangifer tarandus platyrhynchus]CAI9703815.1 unnamed protein product [Rangifer tarandus platyrhynchus]